MRPEHRRRRPTTGRTTATTVANSSQADADGDQVGDACDSTPRGDDADGDGKPLLDDVCPNQYGTLANGCAAPTPAPPNTDGDALPDSSDTCPTVAASTPNGCPLAQVASLSAKAKQRKATIRVSTSGAATVRITVERKKGGRWVRVTRKTIVVSGTHASLKVSRLKRGTHRVRISITSSGGSGNSVSKTFRVR